MSCSWRMDGRTAGLFVEAEIVGRPLPGVCVLCVCVCVCVCVCSRVSVCVCVLACECVNMLYMTLHLVKSLPKILYIHRIYGSGQPYTVDEVSAKNNVYTPSSYGPGQPCTRSLAEHVYQIFIYLFMCVKYPYLFMCVNFPSHHQSVIQAA